VGVELLDRYLMEQAVGVGAHGEVWRAHDKLLGRTVAVKILPESNSDAVKRSLKEAQALAKVNHPNIVTLYELSEVDGRAFLVMEYIAGQTLRDYLRRETPSMEVALSFALQLADALQTIHANGITHGDIKPGNVMITENGKPMLVDFGISKDATRLDDLKTATTENFIPARIKGTLPYMAPEVISGDAPNTRSDIFSFGVLLYELFSGQRAFNASSEIATLDAVMNHSPTALKTLRPDVSDGISDTIDAMLAKRPEARPQNISDFRPRLLQQKYPFAVRMQSVAEQAISLGRKFRGPAVASVIIVSGVFGMLSYDVGPRSQPSVSSLVQSGFSSLQKHQHKGAIDAAIASFQKVLVRDPENAAATAGLSLGLFREYMSDQSNVAVLERAKVSAALAVSLDKHLALAQAAQAWSLDYSGKDNDAEVTYKLALQLEADNFFALEGYARFLEDSGTYEQALELLHVALEYYPDEALFYTHVGTNHFYLQNFVDAEKAFRKGIQLNPDNIFTYSSLSGVLYAQGNTLGAIDIIQQGLQIRPHATLYNNLGTYFFALEQYPQAVSAFESALQVKGNSADYLLWANLADAYRWTAGQEQKAKAAYERALAILLPRISSEKGRPFLVSRAALYYAKSGDNKAAKEWLQQAKDLAPDNATVLYRGAVTAELLGDKGQAIELLSQAITKGFPLAFIEADPELIDLRSRPDFQEILIEQ